MPEKQRSYSPVKTSLICRAQKRKKTYNQSVWQCSCINNYRRNKVPKLDKIGIIGVPSPINFVKENSEKLMAFNEY